MIISKQARREAKELFRGCFVHERLDEDRVRQVVSKVAQTKPRGYIAILSHFERLVKLEVDRRTAKVESAAPLTPDLQSEIGSKLDQIYGAGLDLSFSQNPALLGGLRIQVGSDVYDGSVQSRLAALKGSF